METAYGTRSPNKILESREKDSRTFHQLDSALGKSENKCQKILKKSQNIQKMDKYIRKDVHIPKLKFWGVTVPECRGCRVLRQIPIYLKPKFLNCYCIACAPYLVPFDMCRTHLSCFSLLALESLNLG